MGMFVLGVIVGAVGIIIAACAYDTKKKSK
jgi:hypothetical protein